MRLFLSMLLYRNWKSVFQIYCVSLCHTSAAFTHNRYVRGITDHLPKWCRCVVCTLTAHQLHNTDEGSFSHMPSWRGVWCVRTRGERNTQSAHKQQPDSALKVNVCLFRVIHQKKQCLRNVDWITCFPHGQLVMLCVMPQCREGENADIASLH